MAKIINYSGITYLDLPPDQILQEAIGEMSGVVVIGWDKDEELYCASSLADGGEVLWLLAQAKKKLLEIGEE